MSTDSNPTPSRDALGHEDVKRLLTLGLMGQQRHAQDLVSRLCRSDGHQWFESTLRNGPVGRLGEPREQLCAGAASLEQVRNAKEQCKVLLQKAPDRESRLAALAGYFVTIAAALAHHQTVICGRSREDLDPVLLDLAEVTPSEWSDLLSRATLVPT
jgi:hypothetical protein